MPYQRTPSPERRFAHFGQRITDIFSHTGNETSDSVVNGTSSPKKGMISRLIKDLTSQRSRLGSDFELLSSLLDAELNGGILNDRKYQMEKLIKLAASLPADSDSLKDMTGKLIQSLWGSLHHPPLSFMGDEYRYRQADGSNNNIMYRSLGKAGSSYGRTVTPRTLMPGALPDAATVFDALFLRREAKEHPSKISSMLFYLASIIIHDIFRTDERDHGRLKNSSYLDLSPLYGSSEKEVTTIRSFKGDGTLKPDAFVEPRVLGFPPGVATLLVCFNRFHNYIAEQLAIINEGGRFTLAKEAEDKPDDKRYQKRDNDLFQVARLVTCGLYVNIILNDYVRTILNLQRADTSWTLDPRSSTDDVFGSDGTPSGVGNVVSVEFNLIYRWHSVISVRDAKWTETLYKKLFPDVEDITSITESQLCQALRKWEGALHPDPAKRTFEDLKRDAKTGKFDDTALVDILTQSTEDVAGAFGPRNVPVIMKLIETMGIEQARKWKVASLNEFRKFFKLEPYKRFSDMTSDRSVQASLETLYGHPDYVELYPGIVAEDAKDPWKPGSGLCPGFTLSRTILADAVALTRGDRFYTVDYTPANLTNWGFNQAGNSPDINNGCVMYKLIMRAFPTFYRASSVYAMFPFTHPDETRKILADLDKEDKFDFSRPSPIAAPVQISTWAGVTSVLENKHKYNVPWGEHTGYLTGHDYMLSHDTETEAEQRTFVHERLYCPHDALDEVRRFYEYITMELVKAQSHELLPGCYQLDAVRDVGNTSHAIFMATMFHIPLKSSDSMMPGVTCDQLYQILGALFAYVFIDADPASSMALRDGAKGAVDKLGKLVKIVCEAVRIGDFLMPIDLDMFFSFRKRPGVQATPKDLLSDYGVRMIRRLFEDGKTVDEVVWTIIPTAAAGVATQAQGWAQMLDLYLSDEYSHHWEDIQNCSLSDDPEDFKKLIRYGLEGYRLATPAFGLLRKAAVDAVIQDGKNGPIHVHEGDQIYVNFVSAGTDPTVFEDPKSVRLDRPLKNYIHHGWGPHSCLGREMVGVAMAAQLRVFGRLRNLRRAPGLQGQLKSQTIEGVIKVFMKENWGDWFPFPQTMKVLFDEVIEPSVMGADGLLHPPPQPVSPADSGIGLATGNGLKRTFFDDDDGPRTPSLEINGESSSNGEERAKRHKKTQSQ